MGNPADPYQCINCVYELEDAYGGPDAENAMCIACVDGNNFANIDYNYGARATGKGRFLSG